MKTLAFGALSLSLLVQLVWKCTESLSRGASPFSDPLMVAIVAAFAAHAASRGRWPWLSSGLRVFVGLVFLLSVGDRFGVFGAFGAPGVSWGDFDRFVADTRDVNAFLPASFAPTLAVLATLAEVSLGLALVLGASAEWATAGAALLLMVYGFAMTLSLGVLSTFPYSVFVLAAGAWTLATVDTSRCSVDALLARRRHARAGREFAAG